MFNEGINKELDLKSQALLLEKERMNLEALEIRLEEIKESINLKEKQIEELKYIFVESKRIYEHARCNNME